MSALIELVDGEIVLTCEARDHELAKRIPGGRYKDGLWKFPLSFGVCLAARAEFHGALTVGPDLNEWAARYLAWRGMMMERPYPYGDDLPYVAVNGDVELEHQVWGGNMAAAMGRGLILDPMRLGKTITVIRALRLRGITNFLIVAPNSILLKWKRDIEMWYPEAAALGITVVKGTPTKKAKLIAEAVGPVIVNWEGIRTLSRLAPYGSVELTEKQKVPGPLNLHPFDAIVADEAHKAVDPHAQQTRAWWALAHDIPVRYAMTGTVLRNGPEDLWAVMYGIVPYEYPVKSHYVARYTLSGQGRFGFEVWGWSPATRHELFFILDPRTLRRTWEEAGVVMPERLPAQVRGVEMEGTQAKAYVALKKEMALSEGDQLLLVHNPLELATRLMQAACATPVLGKATRTIDGEDVEVTTVDSLKMPSCKVSALLDVVEEAAGESIIVFAESKLLINLMEAELKKAHIETARITGDEVLGVRQENIDRFQAGEAQVALCTYAAASEGITLSKGTIMFRAQRARSMPQAVQAAARADAMGKTEPLLIVDVLTVGSIESRIWDQGGVKEGHLEELHRDELRMSITEELR